VQYGSSKKDFKVSTEREKKFRKTFEMVEGICHVMLVTGLKMRNTEKDYDDDDKPHIWCNNTNHINIR
jgi:hypothetical protein